MKTLIDIDDQLLQKAMAITKAKTKKATIHTALQELIRTRLRQQLIRLKGSGIIDLNLHELKELRQKRIKKQTKNR